MWMGGKKEGRMTCWMEERWKKVNISIEGRGKGNRRTLSGSAAGRKTTSDFLELSRRILPMSGTTAWMYMINRLGTIRFGKLRKDC